MRLKYSICKAQTSLLKNGPLKNYHLELPTQILFDFSLYWDRPCTQVVNVRKVQSIPNQQLLTKHEQSKKKRCQSRVLGCGEGGLGHSLKGQVWTRPYKASDAEAGTKMREKVSVCVR